ncbi:LysR family transcriptional regulator [Ancylobacter amanitiformis]|uniref:DNA-binding transcriptional LysR family regulator n=1 Tax=Ancylobacter amanitiformis TaxID=217069 RepID=A0ABU0LUU8_9HYPH|nr:LysR family transcriptional regulator [Ancylobacter amanitiformis]MDQ0512481.1 DNA-binding transcriptional LysR family regulator [Ancylobacter amanitiformis]
MIDLRLSELEALREVAAHRSFRAAARHMGVAASSLSHTIASLEARLGVRLFNRTTRSVALSEAGELFLGQVGPCLSGIATSVEAIARFRDEPSGQVKINSSVAGAQRILPLVKGFLEAHPQITLILTSEDKLVDIVASGFDAGLRLRSAVPRDMVAIPVGGSRSFALVASPDYVARRGSPMVPEQLTGHECIRVQFPSGALHRWSFEADGEESRLDPPGRLIVGDVSTALQAALGGFGLAFIPEDLARPSLGRGDLIRLMEKWTPPFEGLCLFYPPQRFMSPALRAFIDHVRSSRG